MWMAWRSLELDLRLLRFRPWPLGKRLSFILKKYELIARHAFVPFQLGQSSTRWSGETIFYDSRLGLSDYQSMLIRPVTLFRVAGIGRFGTVIDCGANVGFFSKMIVETSPGARIYAIEPVPAIYECLKKNLAGAAKVSTFQAAISDRAGTVRMTFDSADSAVSRISETGEVDVTALTLDEFASGQGIGDIDLLKIDTETFEAHVLRGARSVLARTKYVLIEVTIEGNANYSISTLFGLLNGPGYDFQLVAFRNYADRGEGRIPIMDCLLVNQTLSRLQPAAAGEKG